MAVNEGKRLHGDAIPLIKYLAVVLKKTWCVLLSEGIQLIRTLLFKTHNTPFIHFIKKHIIT